MSPSYDETDREPHKSPWFYVTAWIDLSKSLEELPESA